MIQPYENRPDGLTALVGRGAGDAGSRNADIRADIQRRRLCHRFGGLRAYGVKFPDGLARHAEEADLYFIGVGHRGARENGGRSGEIRRFRIPVRRRSIRQMVRRGGKLLL